MKKLAGSAVRLINRSIESARRFPATVIFAFLLALIASVRLELADSRDLSLLNSLQLALYTSSALSLTLTVSLAARPAKARLANLAALPALALFWLLFHTPANLADSFAPARASALFLAALALLPVFFSKKGSPLVFSQAVFLLLKAAFTAAVYSLSIMLGLLFITFAIQALLFQNLSENIYLHISLWSLFIWLPIALAYLPDLTLRPADPRFESGHQQPRFIRVLFVYVLIPLFVLLALVLLVWAIRIVITGQWPEFSLLSLILLAFACSGAGLALLTDQAPETPARYFARFFPAAAILFLLFAAWATGLELRSSGLQEGSYFVIIFSLFAWACALILLFRQPAKNHLIAYCAACLCLITVLPALNYRTVPVFFQQQELRRVLEQNGMLIDGKIKPSAQLIPADKAIIARTVDYLLSADIEPSAAWLSPAITSLDQFERVFGFPFSAGVAQPGQSDSFELGLYLPPLALEINQAALLAFAANEDQLDFSSAGLDLEAELNWQPAGSASLVIREYGQVILKQDLTDWLEDLIARFRHMSVDQQQDAARLADYSLLVETENFQLTFIFNAIYASQDPAGAVTVDYLSLYCALYQEAQPW